MKNALIILIFCSIIQLSKAMTTFEPGSAIKASQINQNFSEISLIMQSKNSPVSFNLFSPGDLILKESLEQEFSKIRFFGVTVNNLSDGQIKAAELNTSFSQMLSGVQIYDDIPVSFAMSFNIDEDSPYSGSFSFSNNVGASLVEIITNPTHGSILKNGLQFLYTPNENYFGNDSFSFRVFDGSQYSNTATVSIGINSVNDIPMTSNQNLNLNEDSSLGITLLASDADGDLLTYSYTQPSHGTLSGVAPNLTYTPSENYFGPDSFSYKVNDGIVDSVTSLVSITVNSVNDAPVLAGQGFTVMQNSGAYSGATSIVDIDSSSFSYVKVLEPTKGVLNLNSNGTYSYTPSLNAIGNDFFQIKANDGINDSNILQINVVIDGSGIIVASGSRTYFDGTVANSCYQYKNQNNGKYTYTGSSLGTGLYNIRLEDSTIRTVYCDMTTDGGGWTLAMRQNTGGAVLASTAAISLTSIHLKTVNAKMADTSIRNLAAVGTREAQIVYNNTHRYIFRYSASQWTSYSTLGWVNAVHDSKNTSGNWVTNACNGHVYNNSFSTWSDTHNARCPTYYQTGVFYYTPRHLTDYGNVTNPAPIDVFIR